MRKAFAGMGKNCIVTAPSGHNECRSCCEVRILLKRIISGIANISVTRSPPPSVNVANNPDTPTDLQLDGDQSCLRFSKSGSKKSHETALSYFTDITIRLCSLHIPSVDFSDFPRNEGTTDIAPKPDPTGFATNDRDSVTFRRPSYSDPSKYSSKPTDIPTR